MNLSCTAEPVCPVCKNKLDLCDRCGGRLLLPFIGPATVRGRRWAERIIKHLVMRWPEDWHRSPRAFIIATRLVEDLRPQLALQTRLASVCLTAAIQRYNELTEYLLRKRLGIVPGPDDPPPPLTPLDRDESPR